jgi:hypothetical protein
MLKRIADCNCAGEWNDRLVLRAASERDRASFEVAIPIRIELERNQVRF